MFAILEQTQLISGYNHYDIALLSELVLMTIASDMASDIQKEIQRVEAKIGFSNC